MRDTICALHWIAILRNNSTIVYCDFTIDDSERIAIAYSEHIATMASNAILLRALPQAVRLESAHHAWRGNYVAAPEAQGLNQMHE
jgi:hypothetical protein